MHRCCLAFSFFSIAACAADTQDKSSVANSDVDSGATIHGGGKDAAPGDDGSGGSACPIVADASAEAICVETISGRLVDENGVPAAPGVLVSACGTRRCEPGFTDDAGHFTIPVNFRLVPSKYSVIAHGRPYKAGFYFRLPPDQPGPHLDVGDLPFLTMPETGPLIDANRDGAPAQSVTSGDATLEIPDGIFVRLDVEGKAAGDDGRMFRALRVPNALLGEFISPDLGAFALYGFEPFESQFEIPVTTELVDVRLTFANSAQLAAGTPVEFLALGTYLHADWITPAAFEPVAVGQVSADGTRIEFGAGQGIPYLTWIAIRATSPP